MTLEEAEMTIEELELRPVSERELRELYEKYSNLFQAEKDSEKRTELYDMCLYLSARLGAIRDLVREKERDYVKREEYEKIKKELQELEITNDVLLRKASIETKAYLGKTDIMQIFSKESDWALGILGFMHQENYAVKINREYYTTEQQLEEFLSIYQGQTLKINTR